MRETNKTKAEHKKKNKKNKRITHKVYLNLGLELLSLRLYEDVLLLIKVLLLHLKLVIELVLYILQLNRLVLAGLHLLDDLVHALVARLQLTEVVLLLIKDLLVERREDENTIRFGFRAVAGRVAGRITGRVTERSISRLSFRGRYSQ